MKKVLIVGCNGLLGQKAIIELTQKYELCGADLSSESIHKEISYFRMDIADPKTVEAVIQESEPDIIFNASAYTAVDRAEIEKEICYAVNVVGVQNLARICFKENIKLLHISTDYVFDGYKGNYNELDPATPINYYGQSKLDGEKAVLDSGCEFLIGRTAVLFGYGHNIQSNFVLWVLTELRNDNSIRVVDDQIGNPTIADYLAYSCRELLEKEATGLFHLAGDKPISRYDLAIAVAKEFNCDPNFITRIKTSEFKQLAKRPLNVGLNGIKVQDTYGINMFSLNDSLKKLNQTMGEF